jgi:hypothetical protein
MNGEIAEKYYNKYFNAINQVVKANNLSDPCYLPSVHAWKSIFLQLKNIQIKKTSMNLGSAEEKSHFNKTLLGFKLIGNNLVKTIPSLFEQCFANSSPSVLQKQMKSLELVLYAISEMIQNFPTSMKNLVARKQGESKDKLAQHLIQAIQNHFNHTEL